MTAFTFDRSQAQRQLEGGEVRWSGRSDELRDNPELLRSAYLLRN